MSAKYPFSFLVLIRFDVSGLSCRVPCNPVRHRYGEQNLLPISLPSKKDSLSVIEPA